MLEYWPREMTGKVWSRANVENISPGGVTDCPDCSGGLRQARPAWPWVSPSKNPWQDMLQLSTLLLVLPAWDLFIPCPSWCRRMWFGKLTSFLWKGHFCPGRGWMQSKVYLSCQSWNDWRCVFVSPGRVPYIDCVYQLDHIPRRKREENGTPLKRGWLVLHAQGSVRCNTKGCSVSSDPPEQRDVRGLFSWKGLQRNIPLKTLGWKHICYYNLLNRWEQDLIRSFNGSRQIQSFNQTVT